MFESGVGIFDNKVNLLLFCVIDKIDRLLWVLLFVMVSVLMGVLVGVMFVDDMVMIFILFILLMGWLVMCFFCRLYVFSVFFLLVLIIRFCVGD